MSSWKNLLVPLLYEKSFCQVHLSNCTRYIHGSMGIEYFSLLVCCSELILANSSNINSRQNPNSCKTNAVDKKLSPTGLGSNERFPSLWSHPSRCSSKWYWAKNFIPASNYDPPGCWWQHIDGCWLDCCNICRSCWSRFQFVLDVWWCQRSFCAVIKWCPRI